MSSEVSASRYSKALYIVAKNNNIQDLIYTQLREVSKALDNSKLLFFFKTPAVSREQKLNLLDSSFSGKIHLLLLHFLKLLTSNGRVDLISIIADEYEQIMDTERDIVKVEMRTYRTPDEAFVKRIETFIKSSFNKQVVMNVITDKNVLGGLSLRHRGSLIDYTISGRLKTLRENLLSNS